LTLQLHARWLHAAAAADDDFYCPVSLLIDGLSIGMRQNFTLVHFSFLFFSGSINIPSSFKSLSTYTRKLSASNSRLIDSLPVGTVRTKNGIGKKERKGGEMRRNILTTRRRTYMQNFKEQEPNSSVTSCDGAKID
jgi:hypothetical protein